MRHRSQPTHLRTAVHGRDGGVCDFAPCEQPLERAGRAVGRMRFSGIPPLYIASHRRAKRRWCWWHRWWRRARRTRV